MGGAHPVLSDGCGRLGPNGSCLFTSGSPDDTLDSQNFRTFSSRQIAFLVAERSMPALLLQLLHQCAGDIEMNPGLISTKTPTNCPRLMQWNANGISGNITELLTFLHSNNVNIAAIHETKLTNKSKPLKTPDGQLCDLTATRTKAAAC